MQIGRYLGVFKTVAAPLLPSPPILLQTSTQIFQAPKGLYGAQNVGERDEFTILH